MAIRKSIFVCIVLFSGLARADVATFVRDHLQIESCKFDKEFIAATLRTAFGRIAAVNYSLANAIAVRSLNRNLKLVCDVGPRPAPVYFDPDDQSIHLRVTNDGTGNTNSNFFHEFLHFAGLEHIAPYDTSGEVEVFYKDPVYSCHMTAFPEMAGPLGIDASIIPMASARCAAVQF